MLRSHNWIFNLGPSTNRCTFIQATILALTPHSITLSHVVPELGVGADGVLGFEYAVYALGSRLPEPLDLWGAHSLSFSSDCTSSSNSTCASHLDANAINGKPAIRKQRVVEEAASVLVVGGGALGIQFASDIASLHPTKRVTLLHSRARLLPRFGDGGEGEGEESGGMHEEILQALHALSVHVVLGERVDLASLSSLSPTTSVDGRTTGQRTVRTVRTTTGREIGADLVLLCTGQTPNTALLRALDPRVVDPVSGLVRVGRGMQLAFVPAPPTEGGDAGAGAPSMAPTEGRDHGRAARARAREKECAGGGGLGAEIRTKEAAGGRNTKERRGEKEPASAPAPADTTDPGSSQADKDAQAEKDSASLLAAALAEIELLEAASGSSSLHRDHANELDKEAEPFPSPSSPSSASSPASPSHSLVSELDKQAADADLAANDDEEEPVLTGETDEAASVDDDQETWACGPLLAHGKTRLASGLFYI
ncbi:hypothetical protein B0H13DRAFT_2513437 [Mycena leptocephala]|nr:hypothetical protein B0H13DRAFT_2513437 [Mycena leptocephala]